MKTHLIVLVVCLLSKGTVSHGAVEFVDPPSGTLIANFEGTVNITTLTCNVKNGGIQVGTAWGIENFRNVLEIQTITDQLSPELFFINGDLRPSGLSTYRNRLTVLVLRSELDGVLIYCGTGQQIRQVNFSIRVYRPPHLQDNLRLSIVENTVSVPVELSQNQASFPEPTLFSWTKDGQPFNVPSLTYSSITFSPLRRSDTGYYMASATNYILNSTTKQVGNDTGSFLLDVIYGPFFRGLGSTQQYVLLGSPLSLVCGTGLDSNPQATINWTAPDGTTVMDNDRHDLDNGPDIVRLNITQTILNDTGMWLCEVIVRSESHTVSDGRLVLREEAVIGTPTLHKIMVTVIAPPGQPNTLSVNDTKPTSVLVGWNPPMADSPITYYSVRACNLNVTTAELDKIVTNTTTNTSTVNVTGLLPGTTYELTVVAVSQGGNIVALSQPSDPVIEATEVTVPALICNALVSSNGVITVSWSYIHTGGLPLTNVSVSYTYEDGLTINIPIPVPVSNLDTTDVSVSDLEFGFVYTFNVTVQNSNGSSSILCGPTLLQSGSMSSIIGAAVVGIIGGCLLLGITVTLIILLLLVLWRRGTKNVDVNIEAVYEDPDSFQQYTPKKDQSIELNECPAYGKPSSRQPDIELKECPAYVEKKKEISNIKLEECPAYVEKKKDLSSIRLEECPAYEQLEIKEN